MPADSGNTIAGRRVYYLTLDDVIPIERGGTGAMNAREAMDNLGGLWFDPNTAIIRLPGGETALTMSQALFLSSGFLWIGNADGVTPAKLYLANLDFSAATTIQPETYHNNNPVVKVMDQNGTVPVRVAKVDLTAQTTSIASTNLLVAPTPGLYRIDVVEEDTAAAAAGTLTTTFGWTSRSGAQTASPAGTLALTGLADSDGSKVIYIASGNLTYLTTVAGVVGSPQYALSISVIRLF